MNTIREAVCGTMTESMATVGDILSSTRRERHTFDGHVLL